MDSGAVSIAGEARQTPCWDWDGARARCLREARRVLRDPLAAEDAVQEALLRAWRQRDACKQPDAPLGWMVQIARNEALRRLGRDKARAERELPSALQERGGATPAEQERRIDVLDLRRALADIPAQERALLTLRYGADLAQPEIAQMLELPEGTVKVRLFRARNRIRRAMENPN